MEELWESEVMWPESHQGRRPAVAMNASRGAYTEEEEEEEEAWSTAGARRWRSSSSSGPAAAAPVGIPSARRGAARELGSSGEEDEEEEEEEGMVPPHVLVSLRRAPTRRAAYSLCSGQGRTLKGRDLRYVRDAVLRMTGFIEG